MVGIATDPLVKGAAVELPDKPQSESTFRALVRICRIHQWSKNLLVFLPLLMSQDWFDSDGWLHALTAFLSLSLAASGVYIINDAIDVDADRAHPRKRMRPFASGSLSLTLGLSAAFLLISVGLVLASTTGVLMLLVGYFVATTFYSFFFKRIALVDVFVLAGLYTLRLIIGGVATGHAPSDWLLAFSSFFFLGLAIAKRAAEVEAVTTDGAVPGRGYFTSDIQLLKMLGIGAGLVATLVLALYLQDDQVRQHFNKPSLLWGAPAAVMFWTCRVWLIVHRGQMHEDPLVFAFRDRVSLLLGLITAASFGAASLVDPAVKFWQIMGRLV